MERHLIERRPAWWLLYVIVGVMLALVALIETSVPNEGTRIALEVAVVVTIFALMLRWVHANRGRIEIAEVVDATRSVAETALSNGQPAPSVGHGMRAARVRAIRSRRRRAM